MSYILQALKRSEQDRSRIQAPEAYLNYERDLESEARRQRFRWTVVGLLGLNVLLIAGLFWFFGNRNTSTPQQVAEPPVAATVAASNPTVETPPPVSVATEAPGPSSAAAAPAAEVPTQPALVENLGPGYGTPVRPLSSQAAIPAPKPRASTPPPARVVYEPVESPGSAEVEPYVPPEIAAMIAAENNTSTAPANATSSEVRGINLNVHVYSKNPKERFVFINGRKSLEGDTLDDMGTKLDAITPEGVVLDLGYEKKLLRIESVR